MNNRCCPVTPGLQPFHLHRENVKGEVPEGEEMDESRRAEQLSEMRGRLGTHGNTMEPVAVSH